MDCSIKAISEERDRFKTEVKKYGIVIKLFSDDCKFENNLSAEDIKSLKDLMRNKYIIIQKADKGNTVVITDKENILKV